MKFPRSFKEISRVFHENLKGISKKFQEWVFQGSFSLFQGYLKEVQREIHGNFKFVSRAYQGSFKGVPRNISGCFEEVSQVFQKSFKGVSMEF